MYKRVKRIMDVLFSLLLLLLFLPVMLVLMLLLALGNQGQVFFTQQRPGQQGKLFKIIKFKTMNERRDVRGQLLPDAQRLFPLGKFIRKSSMDELPQLLNVLKGEMSLIGPRPLLPEYLALYNDFQWRRHEVKPGITGWAQVNGRNAISWKQKFEYDVFYVDHLSFRLDLQIAWLTMARVLQGAGVNQTGQATTIYFTGNKN